MIWRRTVLLGLVILTGLLLETTVLGARTLGGTQAELVLLVVIALGMEDGPATGAIAGFAGGLVTDLLLDLPTGLSSFVFTAIGYAVGALRELYENTTAWFPIVTAGVATATGVLSYGILSIIFGTEGVLGLDLLRHAGLACVYAMLLAPFVVPLIRKLAVRLRPRRVVRL